jgi:hypothetical protein
VSEGGDEVPYLKMNAVTVPFSSTCSSFIQREFGVCIRFCADEK